MTADKPMTPPGGPGQTAGVYAIQSFNEGIARLADLLKSHPELVWVRAMADTAGHVDIIVDAGTGVLHNWVHALPVARRKQDLFSIHSGAAIEEILVDGSLTVHVRPRGGGINDAQLGVVSARPLAGEGVPPQTGRAS